MSDDATRNTTQQNETRTLKPSQEKTLAALLEGQTIKDAATAGGVNRATVHRWLRDDVLFVAEYNRHRRELHHSLQSLLMRIATKAIAVVEKTVEEGDARSAFALLKGLGLLPGRPLFGTDDLEALSILRLDRDLANLMRDRKNSSCP